MRIHEELERLKRMLSNDNINLPNNLFKIAKNDISETLSSYFNIVDGSYSFSVEVNDAGEYCIAIKLMANGVKEAKAKGTKSLF